MVLLKMRRQLDIASWGTISSKAVRTSMMVSWKQLNAKSVSELCVSSFTSIAYKKTQDYSCFLSARIAKEI